MRGHVAACLLAFHLEWHMRRLAPLLYEEEWEAEGSLSAGRGPATEERRKKRRTAEGDRLWDFRSLLAEMRALTRNHVRFRVPGGKSEPEVWMQAFPSKLQQARARLAGGAAQALKPTK